MKAFVVLNPVAGQYEPEMLIDIFEKAADEGCWTYELYKTTGEEDLKKIVGEAIPKNYDMTLACGGDGTVSAVADGLANSDVPLGVLPAGTVNAFASEVGLPDSLEDAFEILIASKTTKDIDAIRVDDRFYLLMASLGNFANSFNDISREDKDQLGWLAYLKSLFKKKIGEGAAWFEIEVDGKSANFNASELIIFNTSQLGVVNEYIDKDISFDDGVLDLYALRPATAWELFQILIYRIVGKPRMAPNLSYWPVQEQVKIKTKPRIQYQADGDLQGESPVTFSVARGVLKVVVPEV